MSTWAQHHRVSQQAINVLTLREQATFQQLFTPKVLVKYARIPVVHKFDHYANPVSLKAAKRINIGEVSAPVILAMVDIYFA